MMTILDLSFLEVFFGLVGIAAGGFLRGFLGFGAALDGGGGGAFGQGGGIPGG